MSKPWDAYQQAPQGQPVPPDGPWSQYQQAPSDVPAEDAMPASESEPARTWLGKMLGVSRNTEAGLPLTIHQGLTFGYGDEINAAAAGLGEYLGFHPGYGYDEALAEQRKQIADYKQAHPGRALAANLAGAAPTMFVGGGGQLMRGGSLGSRMLGGAKLGGGYGAATGFGEGEGLQDRLTGAGSGLVTGAALGGATVPVAETLGKVASTVAQPLKAYLMPTKTANEKLLEALSRDQGGKATLQQAGKTATKTLMSDAGTMVADLGGENTQGLIKQAMRMPNAQREVFKTKLDARQARQVAELSDYLGKKLGTPEQYEDKIAGLLDRRAREARPMFKAAFEMPAVVSAENKGKMARLLSTPTGKSLMEKAVRFAQDEQQSLQDMSSTRIIHIVKMQADDILNGLKNRREGLGAWDFNRVSKFKRELLDLVENDTYKAALKQFSDTTKIKAAGERGFRHGFREDAGAIAEAMRKMSDPERRAYQLGLGKWLITKIRSGNVMHDRVRREFMDKNFLDKMRLALGGKAWKGTKRLLPTEYRKLQQYVGVKGRQADTRRFLQGGSDTARNLMEMENSSQAAQNMTMLAKGVVDPSKIMEFLGRQHSRLTGMTPGVANAVLKRAGQQANRARYSSTLGPRTQDDIDRALAALAAGKPLNQIKSKYREIVKALIALEGYSAGQGQQP